jgi:hypothetical protein
MMGPFGGGPPLQYKLRRSPAPQCSVVLPGHGKLQSESEEFVAPFDMTFPQSYIPTPRDQTIESMNKTETRLTAFLAIFDTSIDIVLAAEVHAVLDSHVRRVPIAGRCERACRNIVPNSIQVR